LIRWSLSSLGLAIGQIVLGVVIVRIAGTPRRSGI
jgi:hypothetical protein